MRKTMIGAILLVASMSMAQSFTDVDTTKHQGKTGLKDLITVLDANFAVIEDGKFVQAIDTNATFNAAIQSGSVTMHAGTVSTNVFEAAFAAGTTPVIIATYLESSGGTAPIFVTTDTNSGFTVTVEASKDFNWIAIGQKP